MNPQNKQNNQPGEPQAPALVEAPTNQSQESFVEPTKKSHKKLALVFLLGPTALIVMSILFYALLNLFNGASAPAPTSGELFDPDPNPIAITLNVFLYLCVAVGVLTWLPGIIIGIILLNKK